MSGWRIFGSSTGSASKTISLVDLADLDHLLGELEQRELVRVADVHRQVLAALREQDQPADEVVDVAEAPRLRAVAEDRDRLLLQRLADEVRDRAPVVGAHPRAVGVEDPDDRGVDALLAVVGHRQRLGVALRLVVDAARADRVDVAPVRLRLRMHLRVAVDLARRGEQEARALELGEAERVVRPVRADLERLQRQAQVVDRARRAREVVDEVDRLVDPDRVRQVVREEDELVRCGCARCSRASRSRGCRRRSPGGPGEQRVAEVRAEEAGTAGDDGGRHCAGSYRRASDRATGFLRFPSIRGGRGRSYTSRMAEPSRRALSPGSSRCSLPGAGQLFRGARRRGLLLLGATALILLVLPAVVAWRGQAGLPVLDRRLVATLLIVDLGSSRSASSPWSMQRAVSGRCSRAPCWSPSSWRRRSLTRRRVT